MASATRRRTGSGSLPSAFSKPFDRLARPFSFAVGGDVKGTSGLEAFGDRITAAPRHQQKNHDQRVSAPTLGCLSPPRRTQQPFDPFGMSDLLPNRRGEKMPEAVEEGLRRGADLAVLPSLVHKLFLHDGFGLATTILWRNSSFRKSPLQISAEKRHWVPLVRPLRPYQCRSQIAIETPRQCEWICLTYLIEKFAHRRCTRRHWYGRSGRTSGTTDTVHP